ncbi:hypothetical protein Nepgr_003709 [Nepenthes gracilis]|uniref:Retrotransposon gag domain-containing protein n=1 Tax=Nepenthes gracilis TaxID=150966 RepID=A0AAD3S009_NEPGR|nr:hypothetical protein Nepgr_003709 [Nepenthes gracilis]
MAADKQLIMAVECNSAPELEKTVSRLSHIEQFLRNIELHRRKLVIAVVYLSDDALQWYTWMRATRQISTWEFFSRDLEQKFEPPSSLTHKAALSHLRQTSIAYAYIADVVPLSIRSSGQIVAQKIPSVSDSRSATMKLVMTVGVPVVRAMVLHPLPVDQKLRMRFYEKLGLISTARDSGLTCMGWALEQS